MPRRKTSPSPAPPPGEGPVFAVSGNPPNFFAGPYGKDRVLAPFWLREIGLDGLEISCTHGVNISAERAAVYRANAEKAGIRLYVHAPYYIALASGNEEIAARSAERITESMTLAMQLGATRVVFHPGGYPDKGPGGRAAALARLIDRLRAIPVTWDPKAVRLAAEIGGKVAALGSLEEIVEICRAVPWVSPCIDFAHLHARTNGGLPDAESHAAVIRTLAAELGGAEAAALHCHVYAVAFNEKGERHHLKYEPDGRVSGGEGGPDYRHFLAAIRATGIRPSVICEGKDSQDVGARLMKAAWNETAPAAAG
jgi:deoxyribonuclease-4